MTPKEIGRAAGRVFQASLPSRWAVRPQEDQEDYGIDYEIEVITPDDQATGFIFKVQGKGTTDPHYSNDGSVLSYNDLSVARMTYYLHQMRVPVVLAVVDVQRSKAYWTAVHGNAELVAAHGKAVAASQEKMTAHIRTANVLPQTATELLRAVEVAHDALLLDAVARVRSDRLVQIAGMLGGLDRLHEVLGAHRDYAECAHLDELRREGKWEEAERLAWKYVNSPSASMEMRFEAGVKIIQVAAARASANPNALFGHGPAGYTSARVTVTTRLLEIARREHAPRRLRLFARALCRAARLRQAVDHEFGLLMSTIIQETTGDEFTRMMTRHSQTSARRAVLREFRRGQVALNRLAQVSDALELLPQVWAQLAMDMPFFITSLQRDRLDEAANGIVNWFDSTGPLCVEIAAKAERFSEVALCAIMSLGLNGQDETQLMKRIARARTYADMIEDPVGKAELLQRLDEYAKIPETAARAAAAEPSLDQEVATFRAMASSLGIDLDDPNDPAAEAVRVGLMDLNPERVLRECQYLFVSLGAVGIPAQMLGLPTAGSKYVHCTKFGYTVGGFMLDGIWKILAFSHCRKCGDRCPHPPAWHWTREWQREQDQKWERFASRRG